MVSYIQVSAVTSSQNGQCIGQEVVLESAVLFFGPIELFLDPSNEWEGGIFGAQSST